MKIRLALSALASAALALTSTPAGATTATATTCGTRAGLPSQVTHVVWIWMENKSVAAITPTAAPYITSLQTACAWGNNYHGLTHPSAPNYIGATSGLPLASLPATDCTNCRQNVQSIFNEGKTWKAYQENMVSNCATYKSPDGLYVPRHNPPHYFIPLGTSAGGGDGSCLANDVPYTQLSNDLTASALPTFSFVTPNLADDMHNGANLAAQVANGDTWLAANLPLITQSPQYLAGQVAVFIAWDEGNGTGNVKGVDCTITTTVSNPSCNPPLYVVSPYTVPGTLLTGSLNHYSLLRTTQDILGLLPLLGQASTATDFRTLVGL